MFFFFFFPFRRRLDGKGAAGATTAAALADVKPVRGRLLVFPHDCPHAGRPVIFAPKLVLRGELW